MNFVLRNPVRQQRYDCASLLLRQDIHSQFPSSISRAWMMSCRSSGSTPDLTSGGQLLGDFEVAITGGIWVAAGVLFPWKLT